MTNWLQSLVASIALAVFGASATLAQDAYPSKPVHLYVPFPPGGAVDIVARTLGEELAKRWGQSVVVENRPGAGGIIAEQGLAQSPPDGYTLAVVATGHALNGFFYTSCRTIRSEVVLLSL